MKKISEELGLTKKDLYDFYTEYNILVEKFNYSEVSAITEVADIRFSKEPSLKSNILLFFAIIGIKTITEGMGKLKEEIFSDG